MFKSIPTPISQGNGLPAGAGAGPREGERTAFDKILFSVYCSCDFQPLTAAKEEEPSHLSMRATRRFEVSQAGHLAS